MPKVLLVVVLFLVTAQLPSCEVRPGPLVGFVDDKYMAQLPTGGAPQPTILIGATEYTVPIEFYREVEIGDLVKWENGQWSIVRKARAKQWPGSTPVSRSSKSLL